MTQPSKPASAFLILFALPFLCFGAFAAFTFLTQAGRTGSASAVAGAAIGGVFALIGGGLIFAAVAGYGKLKHQSQVEEQHPGAPWLWRPDWALRRAESQNKRSALTLWISCALWNAIALPVTAAVMPQISRHNLAALPILGLPLIGLILFIAAARASIRRQRFGKTYFEFSALPFSPGEHLTGNIHLRLETSIEHGIDLRLSCVRRIITGSGKNRSTQEVILWQEDRNVVSTALGSGPLGRRIPVDFALPPDAFQTDHDNPSDQVLWLLHASADVPGVDYSDDFEVPVFRKAQAAGIRQPSFAGVGVDAFAAAAAAPQADASPISAPPNPQVVISTESGGTQFYFPALRNPGRAFALFLFTCVWSAVVYFLFRSSAPWIFGFFFGLFDVLLIYIVFRSVLMSTRITVGNGEILVRNAMLAVGVTTRYAIADVAAILPVISAQQGGASGRAYYAIRLRTASGRKATLADEIASRQEARWVVSQIESLAGLKQDTHVEYDGIYGTPPQPGELPVMRRSAKSGWIGLVFFAIWMAIVFGFIGRGLISSKATRKSGSKSAPVQRRVFSPMTEGDVQRVLALAPQEQAEELLERSIGHDRQALELFQQNVSEWTSNIHETPRMKDLEARARYSTDLRVRQADADIELALDGWKKTPESVDLLIERARTDQRYRPAALYFLGMLGGSGIEYDRVRATLLDYAISNSDPYVRQWAVEGMRFLNTEQALDELFERFTRDASFTVRDRAGCNISDCGVFQRKYRMRSVPKLLALLDDRHLDRRMRNWCFMALREITDESLPDNPAAWHEWYQQHGADKLAQFEALEWWQVRGDE